ncbi:hypothetical protein GCM10010182_51570 [Actinomadura cremea]|nr:hypothetical protein GCM10010182_51570 [Actinomadura cremea]
MGLAGRRRPAGADGRTRAVGTRPKASVARSGSVRLAAELESVAVGRRWLRGRLEDDGVGRSAIADLLQRTGRGARRVRRDGDVRPVHDARPRRDAGLAAVEQEVREKTEPKPDG